MARTTTDTNIDLESDNEQSTEGSGGWETPTAQETVVTPCKRHTFKGGDTCVRCGAPRTARVARPRAPRAVGGVSSRDSLETVLGLLWGGIGLGVQHQPLIGKTPRVYTINDEEVEGASVSEAVGKALQMEAAVAGRRIDHAWRKGSPLSYLIVNAFVNKVTWATDLAPLLAMPLIAALPPVVLERIKPQLAQLVVPVLVEQAQMIKKQSEMMGNLDAFTKQAIIEAERTIDQVLGIRKEDASNGTSSNPSAA
jgi:hypothetical protein